MPSERMQRSIDALLDEAEERMHAGEWQYVAEKARAVLSLDGENVDALGFLGMAVANGIPETVASTPDTPDAPPEEVQTELATDPPDPDSFAGGRYQVRRFLGEGGKKRVFLAHDELLDRDVAVSLIKTEGLDEVGRERIMREAQAMGRLTHQNIVSIYDIGEHTALDGLHQPYLVQELMGGGDVEGLLEDADGGLPLRQSLDIAIATSRGLEFAHSQGVVHRDLKPGNVWLTDDGTAKVGDLGLAVTLGQTRLTEHGMMVGTYGYMPPEQALGDEITPQADLYALGAMLYELVTGRPPFEGDTAHAVISQHLNSRPVAPSWRSDQCPPELEALVLQLLEKVPADRPSSASEVIARLQAIDPQGVSASRSDSLANPLDRLARGIFVGRERELEQLRGALDAAFEGRGSVAMLVGEPGIGKTRTVQELETYARMRGGSVFWGRAHESEGMPAYWPWLQVGRAWGAQQDQGAATFRAAIAHPEIVRLFPELRQQIPTLPEPPEHRDAESAQFLLFDAFTQFVRVQASENPWVIVLDDLHWADKPTLQLLQFMAGELSNMNVLIVGTYRDTDLARTNPLSLTLAELNREGGFTRVALKGLGPDEVASYVRQRAAVEPPARLLDRIYEETEGNPFFLSEIVNLLVEEGSLASGFERARSVSDVVLPDGVREALGRRLDRLSEDANELLKLAAVVGREFAFETLTRLTERSEEDLLALVEESLRARVIEDSERLGRYRFTHALMQETLLDELGSTQAARLHGRVAEALERRWSEDSELHASLLARHYLSSALLLPAHQEKARHYSLLAGAQAEAQSGWAEAVRLYETLMSLESGDERQSSDVSVLIALGRARLAANEFRAALRMLWRALEVCRAEADWPAYGDAALVLTSTGPHVQDPSRQIPVLEEALLHSEVLEAEVVARLSGKLALASCGLDSAPELIGRARDLAQELGLSDVSAEMTLAEGLHLHNVADPAGLPVLGRAAKELEEANLLVLAGEASQAERSFLYALDGFEAAAQAARRQIEYGTRSGQSLQITDGTFYLLLGRLHRGDLAALKADESHLLAEHGFHFLVRETLAIAALWRGERDRAVEIMDPAVAGGDPWQLAMLHAGRAWVGAHLGLTTEVRGDVDATLRLIDQSSVRTHKNAIALTALVAGTMLEPDRWSTEASAVLRDRPALAMGTVAEPLPAAARGRIAVNISAAPDLAEKQLDIGLAAARREGFVIEEGRLLQDLASVSERREEMEAARHRLDEAGDLFSRFGASYYLDQVIAKKEILKA